jgi:hypothetical protein
MARDRTLTPPAPSSMTAPGYLQHLWDATNRAARQLVLVEAVA